MAAALVNLLKHLQAKTSEAIPGNPLQERYNRDPIDLTGESYLAALAASRHQGDVECTVGQLLNDFC